MGLTIALIASAVLWKLLDVLFTGLAMVFGLLAGVCLAFALAVVIFAVFAAPSDPDHRSSRRDD